jgi:hypothetical protein
MTKTTALTIVALILIGIGTTAVAQNRVLFLVINRAGAPPNPCTGVANYSDGCAIALFP